MGCGPANSLQVQAQINRAELATPADPEPAVYASKLIVTLVQGAVVCPQLTCCIHQLFLGSIMPSQVGFASDISKFRVFVFRVRVF